MNWKIPLFKTYTDNKDVDAVSRVIQRGTFWADGPEIKKFEDELKNFLNCKHCLTFNSGTSALHILLETIGVRDKEVLVPSFSFIATVNAVLLAGGKPVFVETENETFGIDYQDLKTKVTKNTKAIVGLHYGGFPSKDTLKIKEFAEKNGIMFFEDAAASLGAKINDQNVGTIGDGAIFSFCQNKVISTGEGGVLVTNNNEIFQKAKLLRSHGRVDTQQSYFESSLDNDYTEPGYNLRMPSMNAALGSSQLKKIQTIINLRREKYEYLKNSLRHFEGISFISEEGNNYSVCQMITIRFKDEKAKLEVKKAFDNEKIMTKTYFEPIHLKSLYAKYGFKKEDLPNTENLSRQVLTVPFFPQIEYKELDLIIKTITNYFNKVN
ncbi:hypothetical protein BVX95_00720 [archaeon D22]|nr:hypothetical protein BVX95_00720 [archaeon D22]